MMRCQHWQPGLIQATEQPEACVCSPMRLQGVVGRWTASSQPGDPEVNYSLLLLVCLKSHPRCILWQQKLVLMVSLLKDYNGIKDKKRRGKKKKQAPGRQLAGDWVLLTVSLSSKEITHTHSASRTSCSALCRHQPCRQDTQDRLLYRSALQEAGVGQKGWSW